MAEGLQPHRRAGDLRVAGRRRPVRRCAAQQRQDAHPVANRPASPVCPRPAPLELEPWHPLPCPVIEIVRSTFALSLSPGHHPAEGDSDSLPGAISAASAGDRVTVSQTALEAHPEPGEVPGPSPPDDQVEARTYVPGSRPSSYQAEAR